MNKIELSCTINESLSTHYLIYRITNNINGKYYIGQHTTNDPYDRYMGSGKIILDAEDKYGLSAFTKTILFDFDNFDDMNDKEKELVQLSNCYPQDPMSYNLREGGSHGALSEESKKIGAEHCKETWKNKTQAEKDAYSQKMSNITSGENNGMFGYKWSDEQRQYQSDIMKGRSSISSMSIDKYNEMCEKLSKSKQGANNPMFGHNSEEFMTQDAIIEKRQKISNLQTDTKCMTHPSLSHKMIRVKIEDVETYLALGYTFYKFPPKPPVSKQTRIKLSNARKCKPSPTKGKPSKMRGKKLTSEQKDKRNKLMQERGTNKHSEETCKKHAIANSKSIKGRIHMIHPITLDKKFPKKEDIQKFLNLGYITSVEYTRCKNITNHCDQ